MISIILVCFIFIGSALMLLVSGLWMSERSKALASTTESIRKNIFDVLNSDYVGIGTNSVVIIINTLNQMSEASEADIFVINERGNVVYCKDMLRGSDGMYNGSCLVHGLYNVPEGVLKVLSQGKQYSDPGTLDGQLARNSFVVASPIMVNDDFRGAVMAVKPITEGLLPYVVTILRMFFIASLFAFIITFSIVYLVSYRIAKPLRQMSDAVKKYADGDFSAKIPVSEKHHLLGHTEIDELASSFNTMATALSNMELSRRDFVSNVSHELKTPMTTISGFIDGILDGTIRQEEQDRYLKIISDEVKRLSRLVTGMLNMNKIEAGKLDIKPVKFDISEMIFVTLLNFEQIIEKRNIDIRGLDTIGENPVLADKDMINQVIYNLVDNAVKFTPDGGYIEVSSKADAEKVIVKIRNSGNGIAPGETEKIFERFYKVDKSRSYDVKGAGMGLYIVKTIIELHGGHIIARSEEGEYAEFIFTLPR